MSTSAHNKRIVIIAGPNGAGKTTFAREFLPTDAELPNLNQRGQGRNSFALNGKHEIIDTQQAHRHYCRAERSGEDDLCA